MRRSTQLASGFCVHAAVALLLVWLLPGTQVSAPPPAPIETSLVWTGRVGLSGGGRGGDRKKAAMAPLPAVQPEQVFTLPHIPAAVSALELPGPIAVLSAAGADGAGHGEALEGGKGPGSDGPGTGTRTGPGAGAGDGAFDDGSPGVVAPKLLFERRPEYTPDAVRMKAEGAVLLEATVLADGTVGPVKVLRSMNPSYGLDQKAIEAVRAWRFRPGTYRGAPAAVRVLIELSFNLS